ncbi:hypothetical protein [Asticcacaulis tiandongensis]|uniref:hypothetical protein n=1 Tax=Asticcacaulis tiandongensis TaxID=2565365 RepID=UPI00112ACEE3|nr:hypothetical protein [Asticcacaulis tiandongensis]
MKAHKLFVLAGSFAALSSCGEGRDLTAAHTRTFLNTNKAPLLHLVESLEECRPAHSRDREQAVTTLNAAANDATVCQANTNISISDIRTQMRALEIPIVNFSLNLENRSDRVEFVLYTQGLGVSGRSISLLYVPDSGPHMERQSPEHQVKALESLPSQWYWESRNF